MAKSKSIVYLGYEDEEVTEKHRNLMNSTVNKIGGCPDWPVADIKVPNCPICSSVRPLLVQLYAPLDNSQFHRTLYVFACLHPSCSSSSKGWLCLRTQNLDTSHCDIESAAAAGNKNKKSSSAAQKMSWCSGVDDWGDDADDFNQNEENGNVIKMDNSRLSDDEDESNSMENDLICALDNLDVDDKNANCNGAQGDGGGGGGNGCGAGVGAFGTVNVQNCCAEIEGGESDVVLVETPQIPERNLMALLKESGTDPCKITDPTLRSFFLAVDEERSVSSPTNYFGLTDHVRDLYQEYKKLEDSLGSSSPVTPPTGSGIGGSGGNDGAEGELYEKGIPVHGDIMFHNFLSSIQANPGQLIRYSRDGHPLLIAPLTEPIPKCPNCGGETVCEVQILSTLIPKLRMQQNDDAAPIEYGNVLVFTCLNSCWDTPDKMRYENIIVQKEI
ncbi:programmed cell death protein 2-like [Episyrphus balteatus]|uniref:programmed cell death protein 2-like n=1 Tax=Episyrphus balteatus TaxID=286459 RepID=UPI002484E7C8|nr:programmed cell death protein 2-like [Episyrphus balteatus]XP_055848848.1 programmed cell death protein 2-like [Episyrphus balteatus]